MSSSLPFPTDAADAADAQALWRSVLERIDTRTIAPATQTRWLRPLLARSLTHGVLTLAAPDAHHRYHVSSQYGATLETHLAQIDGAPTRVRLVLASPEDRIADLAPALFDTSPAAGGRSASGSASGGSAASGSAAGSDAGSATILEPFIEGHANRMARQAMEALLLEPQSPSCSPLFLYGPHGCGKSLLLRLGADALRARGLNVVLMTGEEFLHDFTSAVRTRTQDQFKRQIRQADAWFIDDFHAAAASGDATRRELMFFVNLMERSGRRMAFTAGAPPARLDGVSEALASRLGGGMMAEIGAADYALRGKVLYRAARARAPHAHLPDAALDALAQNASGDLRLALGALNRLIAQATLHPNALPNSADAQRYLDEAQKETPLVLISIEAIQHHTAQAFGLPLNELMSRRRTRNTARARQVAMYLAKHLTRRSYPDIGQRFDGRDHTTVIHAVRRVEGLMDEDADLRAKVATLTATLRAGG